MKIHALSPDGTTLLIFLATLLLVLFGLLTIFSSEDPTNQISAEIDESTFVKRLQMVAGPGARNCGFVRLDRDFSVAAKCRDNALENSDQFYYAFKTQMRWWIGLAMDHSGKTWIVEFDHENPQRGSIRIKPCIRPHTTDATFGCESYGQ